MIWRQLSESFARNAERTAVHADGVAITYAELRRIVETTASQLPDPTPNEPARVLVKQADSFSFLVHVLACWRRGCIPVLVRDGTNDAGVDELTARVRPVAVRTDLIEPDAVDRLTKPVVSKGFGPTDEAMVVGTSGTTGLSKLVALPAAAVTINPEVVAKAFSLSPDDKIAVATPLGYMLGLMGGAMVGLVAGCTIHLIAPGSPPTQLQASIRTHDISVVQGPSSFLRLFLAYWNGDPFRSVRLVTTGGEAVGAELPAMLTDAFPNAEQLMLYGSTEAGARISQTSLVVGDTRAVCVGRPYPHFEYRIEPIGDGEDGVGRLALRGPTVMLGYLGDDGSDGIDADGWYHTNDLVSRDDQGQLSVHGRLDRLFKRGGSLVNPAAVEQVARQHPAVTAARCEPAPHQLLGLVPELSVVVADGVEFDTGDLLAHCRARLDRHEVPTRLSVVEGFELAPSGKMRR